MANAIANADKNNFKYEFDTKKTLPTASVPDVSLKLLNGKKNPNEIIIFFNVH